MLSRLKSGKEDLDTAEGEMMGLSLFGSKDGLVNGHADHRSVLAVSFLFSYYQPFYLRLCTLRLTIHKIIFPVKCELSIYSR